MTDHYIWNNNNKKIYQLHEAQPNLAHYNSLFPFLKGPLVPFPTERPLVGDSYSQQYWVERMCQTGVVGQRPLVMAQQGALPLPSHLDSKMEHFKNFTQWPRRCLKTWPWTALISTTNYSFQRKTSSLRRCWWWKSCACVGTEVITEVSTPSAQLCYKPETALILLYTGKKEQEGGKKGGREGGRKVTY